MPTSDRKASTALGPSPEALAFARRIAVRHGLGDESTLAIARDAERFAIDVAKLVIAERILPAVRKLAGFGFGGIVAELEAEVGEHAPDDVAKPLGRP